MRIKRDDIYDMYRKRKRKIMCVCVYIYIYIEREREREREIHIFLNESSIAGHLSCFCLGYCK